MASQGSGLEILEQLSQWPAEKVKCHLDQIVPELLSCLSNDDKSNVLPAVHALLVRCLPGIPLRGVDEDVLQYAMPAVRRLFSESIEGIKTRLSEVPHSDEDDIIDTLSSLLQVCVELLKCMDSVLLYIISQGTVAVTDVSSVPVTVVSLILETFKHCKESESLYGRTFPDIADILSSVFRQCYQIQSRFFEAITLHVQFECSLEDDVSLLVEILQILCQIGEQVIGLDVKSMAEQWKGFAKLVQQHLEPIRQRLDVSYPLCYLAVEVERNLEQVTVPNFLSDPKTSSKHLKTTSFILKIIVKLSEQFGSGTGCLGNCCSNLLQLLLALHRYSPPSLSLDNVDPQLLDEVERHWTVAADPLLLHLVNETDFKEEYFKKSREIYTKKDDCLPFLLLTMALIRRLIHCSMDQRTMWLEEANDHNVLGCLFNCLKIAHVVLCNEVSLPLAVISGQPSRNCDLFEALVCHCAALVLSASSEQFSSVEQILLDSVFDSYFWPALLAGDVLCVCARAGPTDLTLDLVLYLSDIVCAVETGNNGGKLEYKQGTLLLRRLFALLGNSGKQTVIERYSYSKHTYLWKIIGINNLPKNQQETAEHSFVSNAVTCLINFVDKGSSVTIFKEMLFSLFGLSAALDYALPSDSTNDLYDNVLPYITKLWKFFSRDLLWNGSDSSHFHGSWFSCLFEILCACTQRLVLKMTNAQIMMVLSHLKNVEHCNSVTLKLSSLKVLRGLSSKVLHASPEQDALCSLIAHVFGVLLSDTNPLVKESTLDAFEYLAHCTAHESIVVKAVNKSDHIVQTLVAQYLKKEAPLATTDHMGFSDYLIFQRNQKFTHKCNEVKSKMSSPIAEENPRKKIRAEDSSDLSAFLEDDLLSEIVETDVLNVVSRLCNDTSFLISSSSFKNIPSSLQKSLKQAVADLTMFVKS